MTQNDILVVIYLSISFRLKETLIYIFSTHFLYQPNGPAIGAQAVPLGVTGVYTLVLP